jgi:type 1 fimbria pilin
MRGIRVFSLFSIVLFSLTVLHAQTNGAMLYAHGNVTLNGQAVSSSTTISTGDRLDTADFSVVTINRTGSSIVVNPNSSIQYGQSSIEIMRGTARLSTLAGMSAQAGELTITPKDGMAKFDIVRSDNGTTVTTREGILTLQDGSRSMTLQPGTTTLFASSYRDGEAGILPIDRISTFNTALVPDLPICEKVSLCFGIKDASESHPCRCHNH